MSNRGRSQNFQDLFFLHIFIALLSLCHRPRNCNLSNLCGCCKSLAPEIVSWFLLRLRRKARCARLSPPADSSAFGARARFSSRLRRLYLGQMPRIESLTKTKLSSKKLRQIYQYFGIFVSAKKHTSPKELGWSHFSMKWEQFYRKSRTRDFIQHSGLWEKWNTHNHAGNLKM